MMTSKSTLKKVSVASKNITKRIKCDSDDVLQRVYKQIANIDEAGTSKNDDTVVAAQAPAVDEPMNQEENDKVVDVVSAPETNGIVDDEFTLIHLNDDCLLEIFQKLPFFHLNRVCIILEIRILFSAFSIQSNIKMYNIFLDYSYRVGCFVVHTFAIYCTNAVREAIQ